MVEGGRRWEKAEEGGRRQWTAVGDEKSRRRLMKKVDLARWCRKQRGAEVSKSLTLMVYKENSPPSSKIASLSSLLNLFVKIRCVKINPHKLHDRHLWKPKTLPNPNPYPARTHPPVPETTWNQH